MIVSDRGSHFLARSWSWVIVAHIFRAFKKWSLVIVAHVVTKWSLVIVAHEKSDRHHLCAVSWQVKQGFSYFFPKFLPYLMFFQCGAHQRYTEELWKIIKYCKNLAQNEENSCSTCLKPISRPILRTRSTTSAKFYGHFNLMISNHVSKQKKNS